jgi:hypothetical protein
VTFLISWKQARKFSASYDEEEELEEDNLLDTAIENLEPYGMFKQALLSKELSVNWSVHLIDI